MELALDLDMVLSQSTRFLLLGIDDVNELGLQGSSTHKETINVSLAAELFAGSTSHRT